MSGRRTASINTGLSAIAGFAISLCGFFIALGLSKGLVAMAGYALPFMIPVYLFLVALPFIVSGFVILFGVVRGSPMFALGAAIAMLPILGWQMQDSASTDGVIDRYVAEHPELNQREVAAPSHPVRVIEFSGKDCDEICRLVLSRTAFDKVFVRDRSTLHRYTYLKGPECLAPNLVESLEAFAADGLGFSCANSAPVSADEDNLQDALLFMVDKTKVNITGIKDDVVLEGTVAELYERIDGGKYLLGRWLTGTVVASGHGPMDGLLGTKTRRSIGPPFSAKDFATAAFGTDMSDAGSLTDESVDASFAALASLARDPGRKGAVWELRQRLLQKLDGTHAEIVQRQFNSREILFGATGSAQALYLLAQYKPRDLTKFEDIILPSLSSDDPQRMRVALSLAKGRSSNELGSLRERIIELAFSDQATNSYEVREALWSMFYAGQLPIDEANRRRAKDSLLRDPNLRLGRAKIYVAMMICDLPDPQAGLDEIKAILASTAESGSDWHHYISFSAKKDPDRLCAAFAAGDAK